MLWKGNIAYSIWAKSLKQSFVTFEHSLNRLVLPKTAQGWEKVSGVEKGTQSLFSEIPHLPDETEIALHILENHSAWKIARAEASNWYFMSQVPPSAPAHPAPIQQELWDQTEDGIHS